MTLTVPGVPTTKDKGDGDATKLVEPVEQVNVVFAPAVLNPKSRKDEPVGRV